MDFSEALKELKKGKNVTRKGWYGQHYLTLIKGASYPYASESNPGDILIEDFIAIFPQKGGCIPWLCTQSDMLFDDWCI